MIAPQGIVLLAAALLFAGLAGTGGEKPRRWLDLPLAAVMGLAAGHLLFAPGIPRGHDTVHHLWGVWAVAREPGSLWLHGLGLGMPMLQFYGPGAFYATLPFSLAGMSPMAVVKAGFLAFGALAAVTMYIAVTRWTGDRRAGLVAAAAYAFAPYRLLDTQYRAAFGECAALALLPLVFLFGLEAVRDGGRRPMAFAALAAALLIVTHPISAFMTAIGLGLSTLTGFRRLTRNAGVWLLGAALAGFFVVPFAAEVRNLEVGRIAQGSQRNYLYLHGLDLRDLLWRRPWNGLQVSSPAGDPAEGTDREMPFYFGVGLLALLPLAGRAAKGLPWMVLAVLVLSMGKLAAWLSLWVPGLAAIQFPWRFLGLATFGAAAGAGFATARLLSFRRWTILIPGAIAGLLILDAAPFTGAADWLPSYERFGWIHEPDPGCGRPWGCWKHEPIDPPYPFRAAGLFLPPPSPETGTSLFCCVYPEYETPAIRQAFTPIGNHGVLARAGVGLFVGPYTQKLVRLPAAPYAVQIGRRREVKPLRFQRGGGEIRVESDGRPGTVLVLEQYFPGWQVGGDEGWQEVRPTRAGLLKARVTAGQKVVRFRFQRWTSPRIAGWLITGLASLAVLALCALPVHPKADPPPDRG
ncbi:MAG: hypothetical protein QOH06_4324 [Acidobacteriota bacterium]|jgi:hypothetical protein|nr:hypothetical protein [Acidobacteriota bacterium]